MKLNLMLEIRNKIDYVIYIMSQWVVQLSMIYM